MTYFQILSSITVTTYSSSLVTGMLCLPWCDVITGLMLQSSNDHLTVFLNLVWPITSLQPSWFTADEWSISRAVVVSPTSGLSLVMFRKIDGNAVGYRYGYSSRYAVSVQYNSRSQELVVTLGLLSSVGVLSRRKALQLRRMLGLGLPLSTQTLNKSVFISFSPHHSDRVTHCTEGIWSPSVQRPCKTTI